LRLLASRGAAMDVVSGGELERAFVAGVPMSRVVYAGVGKTDAEIRAALHGSYSLLPHSIFGHTLPDPTNRGPIRRFNVESEPEFENIASIATQLRVKARAALRINVDVSSGGHVYTDTGSGDTKFGVDISDALEFFERNGKHEWLSLDGLHMHIGSPVNDASLYTRAVEKALTLIDQLAALGFMVRSLNIGGGFSAAYSAGAVPHALDYARAVVPLLEPRVAKGLEVAIEPGRTISANAGVLLTTVQYVKRDGGSSRKKTFAICDAGMQTLIRPALYGSFHFVWPTRVAAEHVPERREERPDLPGLLPVDVVGPICECSDFIALDRPLPPVKRGDTLCVFSSGAYGMTMASNYNGHPYPAEVMVDGQDAYVIRRRETVAELMAEEV
jgi:diaminopimelate decarboxylase